MLKRNHLKILLKILSWIFHIALLLWVVFMMWICHDLVYDERYMMFDAASKVIVYSDMDVCKTICFFFLILNLSVSLVSKRYNKVFFVIHFLLAQFNIFYFCWLLTV